MVEPSPNWYERYNASQIVTVHVRLEDRPGVLAATLEALAAEHVPIGNVDLVGVEQQYKIRAIQMFLADDRHREQALANLRRLECITVVKVTDEVLEVHRAGSIETKSRVRLDTLMDLRMVYTPGVARVCELIAADPEAAWSYTALGRKIAIVTNGTAVLGLGDIGPLAALPVMEGKAAILARFVNISAEPMLVDSRDPEEIVDIVAKATLGYGAVQLEDIAAPGCFEIEQRLQDRLHKPVFHDDQHGTATVCVAGLINALRSIRLAPEDCRAVVLGAGAAGTAIAKFLARFGIGDVVVCDSAGAIYEGRMRGMNQWKEELARMTNRERTRGPIAEVIRGRHLFVGVSRPNQVTKEMITAMARDPIVFALANPVSEISVADALAAGAAVALDGRGMNNALAYPGIFRGALEARAERITPAMMLAAAHALAEAAGPDRLLPDMLDLDVHRQVSRAVADAWAREG